MNSISDTNIDYILELIKPCILREQFKLDDELIQFISKTRETIGNILIGKDKRFLCIVGPCSIHNFQEALDYAIALNRLREQYRDKLFIVMRTYFEKPRTTIGWKGFINDPYLDNTFNINKGLELSRELLFRINNLGLPCGTEILDSITPQYLSDLLSWGSIGSRTVESQVHRQIASGCSFPIGFKNGYDGNITMARDAVISAAHPHCFRGISLTGEPSICKTKGNKLGHVILRGSYGGGPNYSQFHIEKCEKIIKNLETKIIIDCSHGNSNKDYRNQRSVIQYICNEKKQGDYTSVVGIMLESNIYCGKQKLLNPNDLKYGVSITDSCVDLEETNFLLQMLYNNM